MTQQLKRLNFTRDRIIALLNREYPDTLTATEVGRYLSIAKAHKHLKKLVEEGEVVRNSDGGYIIAKSN